MISGPCQETSYTTITLNLESSFTRRERNLSLFHWHTSMLPEQHIRHWMLLEKHVEDHNIYVVEWKAAWQKNMVWEEVGAADASSNALYNPNKRPRWNLPKYWEKQDKVWWYCRSWRAYDNSIGRRTEEVPWRLHCCKRNEFTESLQFCAQVDADASSIKNTRCEGCSGKRMEKLEKYRHGSRRKSER